MTLRRTFAALALLLAAPGAWCQWDTVVDGEGRNVATVRSGDGAVLRIWLDAERQLRASFDLGDGLAALDAASCPTFQIDDQRAENLGHERYACEVNGVAARVIFGRVEENKIDSSVLLNLMNGSQLEVRYRLSRGGYGGTRFTLRRSKQALNDALGEDVAVAGD